MFICSPQVHSHHINETQLFAMTAISIKFRHVSTLDPHLLQPQRARLITQSASYHTSPYPPLKSAASASLWFPLSRVPCK